MVRRAAARSRPQQMNPGKPMTTQTQTPLMPPEESAWQKYSPHFELPIAGATSLFLHSAVIGILLVFGLTSLLSLGVEAAKPARMDVVMIEGGGGGFEGMSGESGLPGQPNVSNAGRTENVSQVPDPTEPPRPA